MAKPKLTREDCEDIRRMYADRTRKETSFTISKLYRNVTPGTINRVVNGLYTPLEDYEAKRGRRSSLDRKAEDPVYAQDELFMLGAVEETERALFFGNPKPEYAPVVEQLLANGYLEAVTVYRRTEKGKKRQKSLGRLVDRVRSALGVPDQSPEPDTFRS